MRRVISAAVLSPDAVAAANGTVSQRFSGRAGGGASSWTGSTVLTRFMKGAVSRDSTEMVAMVAYITSLGDIYAATGEGRRQVDEPTAFKTPPRAADLGAGERVFGERCAICHGSDGAGLHATPNRADGLCSSGAQGAQQSNDGAGMHRVLTAATIYQGQDAAWKARPDRR